MTSEKHGSHSPQYLNKFIKKKKEVNKLEENHRRKKKSKNLSDLNKKIFTYLFAAGLNNFSKKSKVEVKEQG
ncbi:28700_t:CDS:2 [Racocetra persica]|uniref:28700_t:CDS:1 n=1 Tax=Racocetra persica TaxID=160502 RepID=A0ACA9KJZ9_9GLOM|nr:28700_t:CDS:2 [Racocetra persica]